MGASRRAVIALVLCLGAPGLLDRSGAPEPAPRAAAGLEHEDPRLGAVRARLAAHRTGLADFEVDAVARAVLEESRRWDVEPSLVLGVIEIESGYHNFAVSHAGARGLMQIMPPTGQALAAELGLGWRGADALFDPVFNLRLGVAYLARLKAQYGQLSVALAAYNWGPGRIDDRLRTGRPLPRRYARDVIEAYGSHAARLAALPSPSDGVFTNAATNPSTASIAPSSDPR